MLCLIRTVLPAPYNVGYENLAEAIVERVNGRPVGGLPDVVEALASPMNGFHVLDLAPDSFRGQVVLDAATFEAATAEILEAYQVPAAVQLPVEPLPPGGGSCPGDF